jgi:hypothetical protein
MYSSRPTRWKLKAVGERRNHDRRSNRRQDENTRSRYIGNIESHPQRILKLRTVEFNIFNMMLFAQISSTKTRAQSTEPNWFWDLLVGERWLSQAPIDQDPGHPNTRHYLRIYFSVFLSTMDDVIDFTAFTTNETGTPRACEVCEKFTHLRTEVGH